MFTLEAFTRTADEMDMICVGSFDSLLDCINNAVSNAHESFSDAIGVVQCLCAYGYMEMVLTEACEIVNYGEFIDIFNNSFELLTQGTYLLKAEKIEERWYFGFATIQ